MSTSPVPRIVHGVSSLLNNVDQMNKYLYTVSYFSEIHSAQHTKGSEKSCLGSLRAVFPTSVNISLLSEKKIPTNILKNYSLLGITMGYTELLSSHFTGELTEPLRSPEISPGHTEGQWPGPPFPVWNTWPHHLPMMHCLRIFGPNYISHTNFYL